MCGLPTSRPRDSSLVLREPCDLVAEVDVEVRQSANRIGIDLTWFLTIARGVF